MGPYRAGQDSIKFYQELQADDSEVDDEMMETIKQYQEKSKIPIPEKKEERDKEKEKEKFLKNLLEGLSIN